MRILELDRDSSKIEIQARLEVSEWVSEFLNGIKEDQEMLVNREA